MAMILPGRDYCFWFNDLVPDGAECLTMIRGRVVAIPGREGPPEPDRRSDIGDPGLERATAAAGPRTVGDAPTVPTRREMGTGRAI